MSLRPSLLFIPDHRPSIPKRANFEEDEEKTFHPTRRSFPCWPNQVGCGGWRLTPEQETGSAASFSKVFFFKKNTVSFPTKMACKLIFGGYKFQSDLCKFRLSHISKSHFEGQRESEERLDCMLVYGWVEENVPAPSVSLLQGFSA